MEFNTMQSPAYRARAEAEGTLAYKLRRKIEFLFKRRGGGRLFVEITPRVIKTTKRRA